MGFLERIFKRGGAKPDPNRPIAIPSSHTIITSFFHIIKKKLTLISIIYTNIHNLCPHLGMVVV